MDTDSLIVHVKAEGINEIIATDVEKRFDTSYYMLERLLPKGKYRKIIGFTENELGKKIMKEFVGLRAKNIAI